MEKAAGQPVRMFASVPAPVLAPSSYPRASVTELWRQSLRIMSTNSVPILVCALAGLASASILGALASTVLTLDVYIQTGGFFSSYLDSFYAQILIQSVAGTFTTSLARGAITWIGLQNITGKPLSLREALRAAIARWQTLLLSSLLYGALITIGIAGLTLVLRQLRIDVSNLGRVSDDFQSIAHEIGVRTINGLMPDPGSPFTDLVTYARYLLRRSSTSYYWLYAYRYGIDDVPLRIWLIGLGSIMLLSASTVLLRLRAAAIMSAPKSDQLVALYKGMQTGGKHFGYIASHVTLVWIASVLTNTLFIIIPIAVAQYLVVPVLVRSVNVLWPYPVSSLLFSLSTALVGMVLIAFSAVYDARLYRSLVRQA